MSVLSDAALVCILRSFDKFDLSFLLATGCWGAYNINGSEVQGSICAATPWYGMYPGSLPQGLIKPASLSVIIRAGFLLQVSLSTFKALN